MEDVLDDPLRRDFVPGVERGRVYEGERERRGPLHRVWRLLDIEGDGAYVGGVAHGTLYELCQVLALFGVCGVWCELGGVYDEAKEGGLPGPLSCDHEIVGG